jgi:retron-type reverse transcriptase
MKRVGHIYEKILNPDLIHAAICEASRGKRHRADVQRVMADVPAHIKKIQEMLTNNTYKPSPYNIFIRYDHLNKKTRKIQRPAFFPDQVIHWLVVMATKDALMRGMYHWNCGSIPGRGIKRGYIGVNRWLRDDKKNTKYTLKMDIRKYYDSVPHDKLMAVIRHKIKDERMLRLIQQIVDTTETGIPIGNYTSQWFANIFLESLDHYIKEKLGVKYYVRYIDDMVLFGRNKKELHKARIAIAKFLQTEMGLELKDNWQVFNTDSRGVDFLGFVFHRTHIRLRARNFLSLVRQANKIKKKIAAKVAIPFKMAAGMLSRIGQLCHIQAYKIWEKYLKGIKIKLLKKVVRNESKRLIQAAAG